MSGHVDTVISSAFSIGRFWYLPRFRFPESLAARLARSFSHFTCAQAQDRMSSMVLHCGLCSLVGFHPVLEDFVEAIRGFLQVPTAGELFNELFAENHEGGYGPGGFTRLLWECYGEHPLSVLGDLVIRISGAVISLYSGEGELLGHLDQGDLIRERSIGIRVGVALLDGGSYSWEPLYHGLHGIESLGEHQLQVSDHRRLRFRCSVRLDIHTCSGVGCLQSRHGADLSPESTLLVTRRVEGLVLVSEVKILRFELAELLDALVQLLGEFVELLLQALEFRGELGISLLSSFMQLGYLTLQTIDLPLEFGFSLGSFG
ncbi:hypothetical protein F2Q70_00039194 [Brassica cretica]|uniref:Uncharacterized protein n=1 Tax=Brassica cretica TaxID=69181 RepID=A0A8S9KDL0_BRACR|nr:hypothetical protein F2Q70_00039194 [Brassica cretica]